MKDTYLVHGTSIEAALMLFNDGTIKMQPWTDAQMPWPGNMFFFPNVELFDREFNIMWEMPAMIEEATGYANRLACEHYFAKWLGYLPKQITFLQEMKDWDGWPPKAQYENDQPIIEEMLNEIKKRKINLTGIEDIIEQAKQRRGVLLTIGQTAKTWELNEKLDDGVAVYLPDGLKAEYVTGIMPLGKVESDVLKALKI